MTIDFTLFGYRIASLSTLRQENAKVYNRGWDAGYEAHAKYQKKYKDAAISYEKIANLHDGMVFAKRRPGGVADHD